uniref:Uncharacterized protein n=1 Tax=Haptolina ericina TaxID=156174 RepID=A0A7S3FHI0_9EUKA
MAYVIDILRTYLPNTTVVHVVQTNMPGERDRAEKLFRALGDARRAARKHAPRPATEAEMEDARCGAGHLVLDKRHALDAAPKDMPSGHGYCGPATAEWANTLLRMLCPLDMGGAGQQSVRPNTSSGRD